MTQLGCDPMPSAMVAPYLRDELQEGELGGGVGQHHFTPHLRPVLHHDALCLPISSQQHTAHCLGRGEGTSLSSSPQPAADIPQHSPRPETPYLLRKDVSTMGGCCGGDGLGQGPHAPSHVAPGTTLPLQLTHDVVQQHIPVVSQGDEVCPLCVPPWQGCLYESSSGQHTESQDPGKGWDPHPLPGVWGLLMAPITASVARVAFKGSDSNQ